MFPTKLVTRPILWELGKTFEVVTNIRQASVTDEIGVVCLELDGKRLLLVHSTPWEPRGEYVHPHSAKLDRFAEADADIVLYGHTHCQVVKRIGGVLVINPGSAGDARDSRNDRQLSCAVLDVVSEEVRLIDYQDPRYGTA